jgi:hypothetical protein
VIYLATPYSHDDPDEREIRFKAVNRAAGMLMKQGEFVFSPISHTHPIAKVADLPRGWDYWNEYDEEMISHCTRFVVLTLEGWLESTGVQEEIKIARRRGFTIEYMNPVDYTISEAA